MKTSPVAVALALLAALVLGTAFASPALAHDRLKSSDPAKGAKVESLEEVKLTFTASVRFPNVVVRSGDENHQDGKPVVDGAVVTQKVKGDLPPGDYVIAYRVVSSDGHPIEGEIPFTLLGSASPSESPSPSPSEAASESPAAAESPVTAETSAERTPVAALSPAAVLRDEGPESSQGVPGWMWIIVGGVTGVGIGLFFSMRNKKRP
ncbi:copper resistance protein CopC [Streptosporangium sp. NBC_01755]|uniref:copper resistance CopC family protein n=1 Tax=unclassified Streptosporangium TaxID=2632669 RepID=UPI002DD9E34B|nr:MULTISPECIES: copper resistance CopC family protein [unclassified Streptosporangium]WSA23055.1 copper resistance protein CopC [Streptosporangium sp. NBC_01810]WSC98801.1 copper resistance protein CopC [Streptosporangium sp. NBC_01755]